jgi:hypothetical protein
LAVQPVPKERSQPRVQCTLDQRLTGQAAADVELRRRAVARHARQDPDHAIEVIAEVRHASDLLAAERHARGGRAADQRVAGDDFDLAEAGDGKELQGDFRNLAFDDLHRLFCHREPGEPRLDDMAPGLTPARVNCPCSSVKTLVSAPRRRTSAPASGAPSASRTEPVTVAASAAPPSPRLIPKTAMKVRIRAKPHFLESFTFCYLSKFGRNDSRGAVADLWKIRG